MSEFLSLNLTATLLGVSLRSIQRDVNAGKYQTQQVKGRGGLRYEIALNSLPKEAQDRYKNDKVEAVIQAVAIPTNTTKAVAHYQPKDAADLTDRQRDKDRNRAAILGFVEESGLKVSEAIGYLNTSWALGSLPSTMQYALENAFDKRHPTKLAIRTYWEWVRLGKESGSFAPAKREKDYQEKPWHAAAIALYSRPQKPSFVMVMEQLAERFSPAPSYGMIERFFNEQYSQTDLLKGRHSGMKLRSLQYHSKRSSDGMLPWQEVHADGWATHFTAPHPLTGEYVTLEVWDFHDVATRFVPPFAIGLTENFEVIAKGIENAIREGGVMAILQTDSTNIVKNNAKFSGNPMLSISDRAGITIVHPKTVGNAQANGISENFHTWLDKQARVLSTYQQKGMDSLALRRTQKLAAKFVKAKASDDVAAMDGLRKQIAKTSNGVFFESYQQAVDWLEAMRVKWNNHHHSALPKIRDVGTGKLRHQSPAECLAAFKAAGWQPVAMDEAHIVDLFRPRVLVTVRRGVVKPYGGMRFHHADLPHWEGKQVLVSYDIMNYSAVTVMALDGSLICIAPFCETVAYRAMTAYETAQEKRALAQIKLKKNQITAIEQRNGLDLSVIEGHGKAVIELKTVDFSRVEPVKELQRVEYAGAEFAAEPKLRTFADMLADEREEDEPVAPELVDYWGTVTAGVDDDTFNVSEEVL